MTSKGAPVGFWDGATWGCAASSMPRLFSGATSALLLDWKTGKPREDPYELEVQALLLQAPAPRDQDYRRPLCVACKEMRLARLRTTARTHAAHVQHGPATRWIRLRTLSRWIGSTSSRGRFVAGAL